MVPIVKMLKSLVVVLICTGSLLAEITIDLSDKILKVKNLQFYPDDSKGFALYDDGEEQLKFFDWNFKLTRRIPLKKGEGPAEIKQDISALVVLDKNSIALNEFFDDNINLYNFDGTLTGTLPFRIRARAFFKKGNRLIAINFNFQKGGKDAFLAKIFDIKTHKTIRTIKLKEPIRWPDEYKNSEFFLGNKGHFAVGEDNTIYMLMGAHDTLYIIEEDGTISGKVKLPNKARIDKKKTIKDDSGKEMFVTSYLHSHFNMNRAGDCIYICYYRCLKRKAGFPDKFRLIVQKVLPDRSVKEKVFEQKRFRVIGGHKGMVYFFNADDYTVTGVHESEWK